jgi:hypothetical protein
MDILAILEASALEIRTLRESVEANKIIRANQTLRVAISQLRGGRIDYDSAPAAEWDKLNELIDAGRVRMDHTAEVLLDSKVLTRDLLEQEMANDPAELTPNDDFWQPETK